MAVEAGEDTWQSREVQRLVRGHERPTLVQEKRARTATAQGSRDRQRLTVARFLPKLQMQQPLRGGRVGPPLRAADAAILMGPMAVGPPRHWLLMEPRLGLVGEGFA